MELQQWNVFQIKDGIVYKLGAISTGLNATKKQAKRKARCLFNSQRNQIIQITKEA
jgi:hypothetical protein